MRDILLIIIKKGLVPAIIKMDLAIVVNGKMINMTEMEHFLKKTENILKVNGKMVKKMDI
jgi:hypothetical protein